MTIWRMRVAYKVYRHTLRMCNTLFFRLKKCLHERVASLRYTYAACLVIFAADLKFCPPTHLISNGLTMYLSPHSYLVPRLKFNWSCTLLRYSSYKYQRPARASYFSVSVGIISSTFRHLIRCSVAARKSALLTLSLIASVHGIDSIGLRIPGGGLGINTLKSRSL